jgi:hypothetical protein
MKRQSMRMAIFNHKDNPERSQCVANENEEIPTSPLNDGYISMIMKIAMKTASSGDKLVDANQ